MKRRLFKIMLVLVLPVLSAGSALADLNFTVFDSRPAVRVQGKAGIKTSAKLKKPKRPQVKQKSRPKQQNKKPSKPMAHRDAVRGERQYLANCSEKPWPYSLSKIRQTVSSSWQFAKEQMDSARMVSLRAIREGERWAGHSKGEL